MSLTNGFIMSEYYDKLDDADEDQALAYECWYWSTIQDMADLLIANGRDKIMADVTEIVMSKLKQGYIPNVNVDV